jgi:hypothetical protein
MAAVENCEWLGSVNGETESCNEPTWSLQRALQEWVDRCRQSSAALDEPAARAYREDYQAVRRNSRGNGHSTLRGPDTIRAA